MWYLNNEISTSLFDGTSDSITFVVVGNNFAESTNFSLPFLSKYNDLGANFSNKREPEIFISQLRN